jgi:malonate transporter and related proteins
VLHHIAFPVVSEWCQLHPRIRLTLSPTSSFSEFQWGKNLDEFSTKLAVMLSSMPTAVNVAILAMEFNVRSRFVSSVVVVSTAASVFTLTLILALLGVR